MYHTVVYCPKDGDNSFLQNGVTYVPNHVASHLSKVQLMLIHRFMNNSSVFQFLQILESNMGLPIKEYFFFFTSENQYNDFYARCFCFT